MRPLGRLGISTWMCAALAACGGADDGDPGMEPPPPMPDAMPVPSVPMPSTLSDSGLFADIPSATLAPGVRPFRPAYELWTDGAEKQRWIYLPSDAQIDTSDMDAWELPIGTKIWKEFRRGGLKVETRLLSKTGPGDWWVRSYTWNLAQSDALVAPDGADNVLGTGHDVPPTEGCMDCHSNVPDMAVGFSAIMLDHDGPGLTLDDLVAEGRLSHPPAALGPPYFPVPGEKVDRDALGYLHANCSVCHNRASQVYQLGDAIIEFGLTTSRLGSVEDTLAFQTAVCQSTRQTLEGAEEIIVPSSPSTSAVFIRMNLRDGGEDQMPKIGSDVVDQYGVDAVRAWINTLAPCP